MHSRNSVVVERESEWESIDLKQQFDKNKIIGNLCESQICFKDEVLGKICVIGDRLRLIAASVLALVLYVIKNY